MKEHGLILSNHLSTEHNLYLCNIVDLIKLKKIPLINEVDNDYYINQYQKIYKLVNKYTFSKHYLYLNYKKMKNIFTKDYNYMPETFYYPGDQYLIEKKFKNYNLDIDNLWLIKLITIHSGKGVFFFHSLKELKKYKLKQFLLNKYITDLHLIKNKKYDLRLYVLISGLKPLRIYLNKEGLVRIASKEYSLSINSVNNKYIHLTNTELNMNNTNYKRPNNPSDDNANIWSINTYQRHLKKLNVDWENIYEKIKDIIIKTIISVYNNLIEKNDNLKINDNCFYQLLGFDIIIKKDFEPVLIEVNNDPSMTIFNKVDFQIKTNLFVDILNIIGISPFSREKNKTMNINNEEFNNKIYSINNAICEMSRPFGDLNIIFPLKNNIKKYKKYFLNNIEENIEFWKKIS